ncbi:MAG TPA: SEC-C metal-binding domain-containing protein [Symbiobacteriaceae bacterium]|jgi:hypothetical protein|nr:SEC-C metal-binding domain-containing protein [Symbiobacteriaceae bacterium]
MGLAEVAAKATPQEWVELLTDWAQGDEQLPRSVVEAAAARREEVAPQLAELVADSARWENGRGAAPSLAARLLGELKYAGAMPALLKVAERVPEFTPLGDAVMDALFDLGEAARDGLYDLAGRHANEVESLAFSRAVEVLAGLKRDERTWHHLKHGLMEARALTGVYVALCAQYGDQRAVYHLNALLEERTDLSPQDRMDCLDAIERLGGIPTAQARAMAEAAQGENPFAGKVGRNDPCPCGSGKKYKKCCGK